MINLKDEHRIILFIGKPKTLTNVREQFKKNDPHHKYLFAGIYDTKKIHKEEVKSYQEVFDILIPYKSSQATSIDQGLLPYKDHIVAITTQNEIKIPELAKIIPHVPYLKTPTSESLFWSIDKISMRRRFKAFDKKITPKYKVVHDASKKSLQEIEEKIGFPLVIKPTGLAQSLLVTLCFHHEELETELKKTFKKIKKLHMERGREDEAKILVEQFIEGDMYSIDGYVNSRGKLYFCPMVEVKTGRTIGFDDFFGYRQITPVSLTAKSIREAERITHKGVHALGLRSSTFHAELIKTDKDWKIIEIGPRVGGRRDTMYKLSYGFDHTYNDILIRIPHVPIIHKKIKGYTAFLKFFAKEEGTIQTLTGTKKAQELGSFHSIENNKKVGDRAIYAKNGGKSVFNIILFNKERSKLLADIRRLEKMIKIETTKKANK